MQTEYTTITETYSLPSKGLIYDPPINPNGSVRSMTTAEEMKRLSATDRPYETLCSIIEDCMTEKPQRSVYDMTIGDYQYLLQRVRVATYGSDYKLSARCPKCGKVSNQATDLDEMVKNDLGEFNPESLYITLPKTGKQIKIAIQSPRALDDVIVRLKEIKKKNPDSQDMSLVLSLISSIELIDNKPTNPITIEKFLKTLPMADTNYLLKKIGKINDLLGADGELKCKCPECGEEFTMPFRITSEFFGPEVD